MGVVRNVSSALLLACGIVLTFAGLSSALGLTVGGVTATIAAIAALLYAGGAWLSRPPVLAADGADTIIVFDRWLRAASGPAPGVPVPDWFPAAMRSEIEAHCRAALRGDHTHFSCEDGQHRYAFEAAPVQSRDGVVIYGVLIAGAGVRSTTTAPDFVVA
jgi:hypothetical protein